MNAILPVVNDSITTAYGVVNSTGMPAISCYPEHYRIVSPAKPGRLIPERTKKIEIVKVA